MADDVNVISIVSDSGKHDPKLVDTNISSIEPPEMSAADGI